MIPAMADPTPPREHDRAVNVILWFAFALTSLVVGGYFLVHVYRHLGVDAGLATLELLGRTTLFMSAGLALEGLLLRAGDRSRAMSKPRRVALHALWIGVMLLCVGLVVDLLVYAFAGYHLTTAARILFSDGPKGVGQVIEAAGLSPGLVAGTGLGMALALAVAVALSKLTRRLSGRAGLVIQRRSTFRALFISVGALAVLEVVSYNARNPFLWEREIRSVPLDFSIVRPAADLASFRVSLRRPPSARARAAAVAVEPLADRPDVIVFVVESLRRDVVTPGIMPRLSAFVRGAWTFEHAITTGNVTHYSWYGLFCAELPIFFEAVKPSPAEHGSVPLAVLRRLGYRTHLFATPDTEYQDLQSIVFGDGEALLDSMFHPAARQVAERDQAVVAEFAQAMATRPRGGGVYVVALDSSHFDYAWGPGFRPPFTPFAASASIARSYELDAGARAALRNRYQDAVAWVDGLLGTALDAIQASGRMDRSYVVITGDHGEAFWEHGSGTHGTDLSREQLEVGFAMRLPGMPAHHFDAVFSLLDVMPTVLHGLGFRHLELFQGVPVQSRLPPEGAADGALAPRAALTFQGWNERAYRFALTTLDERMLFELDRRDPLRSRRLALKAVTDLGDASRVDAEGRDADGSYERIVRELPRAIDALPFLAP